MEKYSLPRENTLWKNLEKYKNICNFSHKKTDYGFLKTMLLSIHSMYEESKIKKH